jgi:orotidine-5'-phosphate decarboxylase
VLADKVRALGPLCAGIDPSADLLDRWSLTDDAAGLARFSTRCVEAFAGVVPAVKAQVAYFERHGAAGIGALEELIACARAAGLLLIADAKRGDIDATCAAYAQAWLGDGPLGADAVTATPYLGLGALGPMFEAARRNGRCVFVVVRSSNPEGRSLQRAVTASGTSVEDALLAEIAAMNASASQGAAGAVGAVVGATLEPSGFDLATMGGPILAPGMGAQGATAEQIARRFAACAPWSVLVNASRSLLAAGPDVAALREAATRTTGALSEQWV